MRTARLTGPTQVGVSFVGNSQGVKALIKSGIVPHVVRATLIALPMKFATAGFNACSCGFKNRISSMTIGYNPSKINIAVFQFGGPFCPFSRDENQPGNEPVIAW